MWTFLGLLQPLGRSLLSSEILKVYLLNALSLHESSIFRVQTAKERRHQVGPCKLSPGVTALASSRFMLWLFPLILAHVPNVCVSRS